MNIGLINRGNTCYLNTAIQCLNNVSELSQYFISNDYINDLKNRFIELKKTNKNLNEIILSKEYAKLIIAIANCTSSTIEPKSLHITIQKLDSSFEGFNQQDAQEVLSLILDQLHEGLKYDINITYTGLIENELDELMIESIKEWKNNINNKYSVVANLFFGQFINKLCSLEEHDKGKLVSKKFEMFNILNIPIYGKTLYDSLSKYFKQEILETKYDDEKTKTKISVYKEIKLMKIPKYLIIVLKRFNNHISGNLIKSDNIISYPIDNLDLSSYSEGYEIINSKLKLISIGCHIGNLYGGHYYAICRKKDNIWYKYDDDTVTEFNIERNLVEIFKFGYILIYEKN